MVLGFLSPSLFAGDLAKRLARFGIDRLSAMGQQPAATPPNRTSIQLKERISNRLAGIQVMEGVLPTKPEKSAILSGLARSLDQGDIKDAEQNTRAYLDRFPADVGTTPATAMLVGSPELREQVAAFAQAGFCFFYATSDFWALDPVQRVGRGGNGAVTRVLLAHERILLETPRVIVRFEAVKAADRRAVLSRHGLVEIGGDGLPPNTVRASVLSGEALERSLAVMQEAEVVYAEPDFVEYIGQRFTPNDPEFVNQWHHKNIKSESAWDYSKGEGVSIAVIDNGFHLHPELAPGRGSGWFRSTPDLVDADFVWGTENMAGGSHGTACAGMAAARSGNGLGGCGVAFESRLNVVACLSDQIGSQSTLARAIGYAARPALEPAAPADVTGADIISCSLGPNRAVWTIRQILSDAIDFAATEGRDGKGCAIFWACTNGNFPISSDEVCSHPNVSAVGRSREDDGDDGCGWGPQLEFLAPGVNVWLPVAEDAYGHVTGASFAAPCAAGIAAVALAQAKEMTAADLRQLMRDACDKVGTLPYIEGRNARFGHGRVNAGKAVDMARRR
jgi:hypothetical protein